MASFLRRRKARFGQNFAAECPAGEIFTADWEDYVLVTVDQNSDATYISEQPVNVHRARSLESSLDSGYEEIHVPPPPAEEDTAAGAGSICSDEANQVRFSYVRTYRCSCHMLLSVFEFLSKPYKGCFHDLSATRGMYNRPGVQYQVHVYITYCALCIGVHFSFV